MNPMRRRKLEGVLLDVDGTLIDSNGAHAQSWSDAFREFGYDISTGRVRPLIGMGGDKLLPELTGVEAESDRGKALTERRAEIFREHYVPTLRQTRGARALVDRLRKEGLRLVIATSANEEELRPMLKQVDLEDLLARSTSSDDAESSKPDPDIIVAALRKGRLAPESAILLGDTPYDIEAAKRASLDTVALLSGGWDADALQDAVAIYEDPEDVLRHFTASPFACAG
jgi:HAD superfamily hydrolase (TIGR01509 family)